MIKCVDKYDPVSASDCETFQTVSFLSKISDRKDFFREELRKKSKQDNADVQEKLAYALFNLVAGSENNVLESKINVENAIATFDEIVEANPECWLAQIYQIRVLLMLPCNFRDEEELVEDIEKVLEIQKESVYQPYFVIPYLLISGLYWSIGEDEKAEMYINQALKLEARKITVIPDYLIIIFDELEAKLRKSAQNDFADIVVGMKRSYFGE